MKKILKVDKPHPLPSDPQKYPRQSKFRSIIYKILIIKWILEHPHSQACLISRQGVKKLDNS